MGCCNQGLGALAGYLVAGSRIRVGFRVNAGDDAMPNYSVDDIANTIEGCLYNTGSFNYVRAYVQPEDIFTGAYVTIEAEPYHDFAQAEDVGGFIQQTLAYCFPQLSIKKRDAVVVDYVPASAANNPNVQQPTSSPSGSGQKCPPGFYDNGWFGVNCVPLPTNNPASNKCDFSNQSWSDYLACQLGIKPSQAALAGVVVGLVGIIAIGKIVK